MSDTTRLEAFIASSDRYLKAPRRRELLAMMPMSPDFALLVGLPGLRETPRHVVIERLVADGAKIVPHSEREIRGRTMHIQIGRALTVPKKPNSVLCMADMAKHGLAYAAHLGAPEEVEEAEECPAT